MSKVGNVNAAESPSLMALATSSAPRGYSTWSGSFPGGTVTATPSERSESGKALWAVSVKRADGSTASTQVWLSQQFSAAQLKPGSVTMRALEAQPRAAGGALTVPRPSAAYFGGSAETSKVGLDSKPAASVPVAKKDPRDFRPSADPQLRYVGFDADPERNGSASPVQLQYGMSNGRFAVKTGRGQVYDIERYILGQPKRYVRADGTFNKGSLRELLQQLVNDGAISVGAQDRRSANPRVLPIGAHGVLFPNGDGGPATHKDTRQTHKQVSEANLRMLGLALDLGSIFYGGTQLKAAWYSYKTLSALRASGATLSAVQTGALKKSEATLTAHWVGAMAGGASYTLFIDQKHWDEAYSALAAGKPLDALSNGGKAALTLLNWTLVPGSISDNVAQANVKFGKYLMDRTLSGGKLKGLNWGMFINPKAWNEANILRVMGQAKGQQIVQKYRPVLHEMQALQAAGEPVVTSTGQLRVSAAAIRDAGFDSLNSLVKSLTADGFWRVFAVKPLLNSPFVLASNSSPLATANSYLQLAASRGGTAVGANLALQSLNGLGVNGSISLNWNQTVAAMFAGSIRSSGAPGAWAGEFQQRLVSYTMSSTAAFLGSWWLRGILQARGKSEESYSPEQLRVMGNANQALNGVALLLRAYDDAGVDPPEGIFNKVKSKAAHLRGVGETYLQRLHDVLSAVDEKQMLAKARDLDRWLDEPIAERGLTRRKRLDQITIPQTLAERMQKVPAARDLYRTGTMVDFGLAPRFITTP
jgi:hypothetical protein